MDVNVKQRIWEAIVANRIKWVSDKAHATFLGIHATAYNRLKNGHYSDVKDDKWIRMAEKVHYKYDHVEGWVTVKTPTFIYLVTQMEACRKSAETGIFVDIAGVGKSHAGEWMAQNHSNVAYIDCGRCKSKQRFISDIMQAFGCDMSGTYYERLDRLENLIKTLKNPMMVFDEAGDLDYPAFLEIKSLYNRLEGYCAFFMMGANGLEAKIDRGMMGRKVGFMEVYDRFGGKYQCIVSTDLAKRHKFVTDQCRQVLKANVPELTPADVESIVAQNTGLRRIRKYVKLLREGKKAA